MKVFHDLDSLVGKTVARIEDDWEESSIYFTDGTKLTYEVDGGDYYTPGYSTPHYTLNYYVTLPEEKK